MGRFIELNDEFVGEPHKIEKLRKSDLGRIKNVLTAICVEFIDYNDRDWDIAFHEGSITIQKHGDRHKVIKIFIDYDNKLASKTHINILEEDPMVIGLEIGTYDPFMRKQIRDWLRKANKSGVDYYVDPVKYVDWQKTYLLPITDHYYDILFLKQGPCEYEENDEVINMIDSLFDKEIDKFDYLN